MAVNFKELLDRPVDSAKKPPTKPPGTYRGIIASFKFDESKQQRTPFVRFTINNVQPGDDILANPKNLLDDEGEQINFSKWIPYKDFYLTDDALYRLKEFMHSLGIDTAGRSFNETLPEVTGMPVLFHGVTSTSDDGKNVYTNVADITGIR